MVSQCVPFRSDNTILITLHRIRKKARYQELLDCEERLKKVHAHRDLIALRCQSVQKFLSFRKAMLLNSNHENEENHSAITDASHPPLLADIVESVHDFQFRITGDVTDNEVGLT